MAEQDNEKKQFGLTDEDYEAYLKRVDENIEKRKAQKGNKKVSSNIPYKPLIILGAVILIIGAVIFSFTDFFMIDNIQVRGNSYYTAEEVINMAHASVGSNIIYKPGSAKIKSYLKENPNIKSVKVKRQLPSTLIIVIEERTQVAAVMYDKEYLVLDDEAVLLRKSQEEPKLTLISGIKVNKITIGETIGTKNKEILNNAMSLIKAMKENDLYFTKLEMTDTYINACVLDNLICKGTYDQLLTAIEKGRLHKILDTLIGKGIQRGTITFSDDGYASYMPTV